MVVKIPECVEHNEQRKKVHSALLLRNSEASTMPI